MSIQIEIDHINEKSRSVQELPEKDEPYFSKYYPDLEKIIEMKEQKDYENLVVIGNGGSITTFRAYLYAFLRESDKNVRLVTTMDPDYLNTLGRELEPEETIVMPVSKSGKTTGVIESTLYFLERGYEILPVTSDNNGALKNIVEERNLDWIRHPDVGGRFSGLTETALAPAAFAGIDIKQIRKGGEKMYQKLSPENRYNPALNLASALYDAENKGYEQLFTPFYSTRLFGFYPLFVQLMHETVCKEEKGQTVFGDMGPEVQHHTNQRIFGGRSDVISMFFRTDAHEKETIEVPDDLKDIELRDKTLADLNGEELGDSLRSEYEGVKKAMNEQDMPNITVNLTDVSHKTLGKLVALMQYTAVYSAWLRDVNAFNQPDVEKSKEYGFKERF